MQPTPGARRRRRLSEATAIIIAALIGAAASLFLSRNREDSLRHDLAVMERVVKAQSQQIDRLVRSQQQKDASRVDSTNRVEIPRQPSGGAVSGTEAPSNAGDTGRRDAHHPAFRQEGIESITHAPTSSYDFVLPCGDKQIQIRPHAAPSYPAGVVGVTMLVPPNNCESAWVTFPEAYRPFALQKDVELRVYWFDPYCQCYTWWISSGRQFEFKGANTRPNNRFRLRSEQEALVDVLFYER